VKRKKKRGGRGERKRRGQRGKVKKEGRKVRKVVDGDKDGQGGREIGVEEEENTRK
jgi:hypothetical protein